MVRDYETPTVPRTWEAFARRWAGRVGLAGKDVVLSCSPDRYGIPIVLRVTASDGQERVATRRSSDADDAAERRARFLDALHRGDFGRVELDVAGYFVGEGGVDCPCGAEPAHEEWQHAVLRELIRVGAPPPEPSAGLSPEDADDAEQAALDRAVVGLLGEFGVS
jgi:hypothetical protein